MSKFNESVKSESLFSAKNFWEETVAVNDFVPFLKWKVKTNEFGTKLYDYSRVVIPESLEENTQEITGMYGTAVYLQVDEVILNASTQERVIEPKLLKIQSYSLRKQVLQLRGQEVLIIRTGTGKDTKYEVKPV